MRRVMMIFCVLFFTALMASGQQQPKLVVGIVVDQMRMDYLYRYYDKFEPGGFKRLMGDGFYLSNAHYNYVPTVTGPGHGSIYTGSTPAIHGIISNDWYDKNQRKYVGCVEDSIYLPVGTSSNNGDVSPHRLLSTTITDELKVFSQRRSKVIGISIKDRAAVLPAGHMADAAYWYDGSSGEFMSSTYYMKALPPWVVAFNQQKLPAKYLSQPWATLLPVDQYVESGPDVSPYERSIGTSAFPHTFPKDNYNLLPVTPFGNDLLAAFAAAAVKGEQLGKHPVTDFLCVSFSSTDYLGHAMGPEAVEIEDMYLRLDRTLATLLSTLDKEVGANAYTLFLTADHGVAEVPQYLMDNKVAAGYFDHDLKKELNEFLSRYFSGTRDLVKEVGGGQVYLNHDEFQYDPKASGIDLLIATELIGEYLMRLDGIANYFTKSEMRQGSYGEPGVKGMVIRGYNPKRSGDITYVLEPGWLSGAPGPGTSHGSPYTYDTHVPVIFYGWGIKKGSSAEYHPITDIAPTLSVLLRIKFPSGCTGQPIEELFDND